MHSLTVLSSYVAYGSSRCICHESDELYSDGGVLLNVNMDVSGCGAGENNLCGKSDASLGRV